MYQKKLICEGVFLLKKRLIYLDYSWYISQSTILCFYKNTINFSEIQGASS